MAGQAKFNLALGIETLWVTLVRGGYWRKPHWEIAALRNLGLVHTNQIVEVENNPQTRGNIERVKHLVQVETSELLLKRLETELAKQQPREPFRVVHNRNMLQHHLWTREWKIPDMRGRPKKVWGKTML